MAENYRRRNAGDNGGNRQQIREKNIITQKFSVKQLAHYAFYELIKSKSCKLSEHMLADTPELQHIATLHGEIIVSRFENFLSSDLIENFRVRIAIPLIIQDSLYGFILSDGKASEPLSEDDLTIAGALMRLRSEDIQPVSINQSSRILMSVPDLQELYSLSIDIFSELTSSRVTAFDLYDEISGKIIIRIYKNVFSSKKYYGEFELADENYVEYKIVFNYRGDRKELEKIFVDCSGFKYLEAEYIILLVKDKILGFVTISKPVNEREYDQSLFELVESLAPLYIYLSEEWHAV